MYTLGTTAKKHVPDGAAISSAVKYKNSRVQPRKTEEREEER